MECQKFINLLEATSDSVPKFITQKWIEVHDQSDNIYSTNKQIRFKTTMLQSDLCDYSDAKIVTKETITVKRDNKRDRKNRSLDLKKMLHFLVAYQKSIMY